MLFSNGWNTWKKPNYFSSSSLFVSLCFGPNFLKKIETFKLHKYVKARPEYATICETWVFIQDMEKLVSVLCVIHIVQLRKPRVSNTPEMRTLHYFETPDCATQAFNFNFAMKWRNRNDLLLLYINVLRIY